MRNLKLPMKYTELEYLELTGNSYVNTNILTNNDLEIEIEFSTTTSSRLLLGARVNPSSNGIVTGFFSPTPYTFFAFGGASSQTTSTTYLLDGNKHKIFMSNTSYKIDDIENPVSEASRANLTTFLDIYLGSWNNNGVIDDRCFIGQIYSFKVKKDNKLLAEYIPAKIDDKIGFYDYATNRFIESETSDAFIEGPEIPFEPTLADKLNYLNYTKEAIKNAILTKDVIIENDTPFREYVNKILNIIDEAYTLEDAFLTRTISGEYVNNRITSLGVYAFRLCKNLKKFSSTSLTTLTASSVFQESGLEEFYAPNLTSASGSRLFSSTKLKKFICKNLSGYVGDAFDSCPNLEYCDLGSGIPGSPTIFTGCNSLNTLVLRKTTVASISATDRIPQTAIDGTCFIYVPDNLVESYKSASNWSTVASQFKPLSELEEQ